MPRQEIAYVHNLVFRREPQKLSHPPILCPQMRGSTHTHARTLIATPFLSISFLFKLHFTSPAGTWIAYHLLHRGLPIHTPRTTGTMMTAVASSIGIDIILIICFPLLALAPRIYRTWTTVMVKPCRNHCTGTGGRKEKQSTCWVKWPRLEGTQSTYA